jgi:putative ATP-dependent endonuclease of OLD family
VVARVTGLAVESASSEDRIGKYKANLSEDDGIGTTSLLSPDQLSDESIMHLSHLIAQNFRQFGHEDGRLDITFRGGVTALVGRNDSGKSAVIDAIRYALLTRDQNFTRVQPEDFHIDETGKQATDMFIRCRLSGLDDDEKGALAEYLSYEDEEVVIYVTWTARRLSDSPGARRWLDVSVRSGIDGAGPPFEASVREMLSSAYLRPLRDAEHEMSPGRSSRLSQILANVPEIGEGAPFDENTPPTNEAAVELLSLVGLSEYLSHNVKKHKGVSAAEEAINVQYLSSLFLTGDNLKARINLAEGGNEKTRLRQILERLELRLLEKSSAAARGLYGLGSNNLLYMACELLLLGREPDGLPLLLIEEPEAHLHPQRQLRLMEFLTKAAAGEVKGTKRPVQVILSTHSPNLASKIPLQNMVLLEGRRAFSLAQGQTRLEAGDYRFLERFLDVTKANLFFAHGVIVVEGDAEAILLPVLARLLGTDLTEHGVSIVNVGGKGLRRFSSIFQRRSETVSQLRVPVACVTDMDVMPDCAPVILGLVSGHEDEKWGNPKRRWKARRDFRSDGQTQEQALDEWRTRLRSNDGQTVMTFVADHWTLEYDLAFSGLAEEVYVAACLAKNDDPLNDEKKQRSDVEREARKIFQEMEAAANGDCEVLCARVYQPFHTEGASKAIAAQYLAERLAEAGRQRGFDATAFARKLPRYIVNAIAYAIGSGATPLPGALAKEDRNA